MVDGRERACHKVRQPARQRFLNPRLCNKTPLLSRGPSALLARFQVFA